MTVYFNRIIRSTDKAILIECQNQAQVWVPRSAVSTLNREFQEATVATWFTAKNPDLTAPAKRRQQRKPRFAHYYAN